MQETNNSKAKLRKKITIIAVVIVVIALIGIAVTVVTVMNGNGSKNALKGTLAETNGEITTPIGKFSFPAEWAESVTAEENTSNSRYSAKFYGTVGKDKVLLFELIIGTDGNGYQLGTAPDASGSRQSVWIDISTIEPKSSWTKEETENANLLQSCVNDIIDQLNQLKGFESV